MLEAERSFRGVTAIDAWTALNAPGHQVTPTVDSPEDYNQTASWNELRPLLNFNKERGMLRSALYCAWWRLPGGQEVPGPNPGCTTRCVQRIQFRAVGATRRNESPILPCGGAHVGSCRRSPIGCHRGARQPLSHPRINGGILCAAEAQGPQAGLPNCASCPQALLFISLEHYSKEGEMQRRRALSMRSVWRLAIVLSIVLVVVCAVAGYEIYHLRNEVNGLQQQVNNLSNMVTLLSDALTKVAQQGK